MKTENNSRATPEKQLLVKEVIDRYPRMLRLLKGAESELHHCATVRERTQAHDVVCVLCQIRALLAEVEK